MVIWYFKLIDVVLLCGWRIGEVQTAAKKSDQSGMITETAGGYICLCLNSPWYKSNDQEKPKSSSTATQNVLIFLNGTEKSQLQLQLMEAVVAQPFWNLFFKEEAGSGNDTVQKASENRAGQYWISSHKRTLQSCKF